MNMKERLKLEDSARIQDISLLDKNGEIEKTLVDIYCPCENNLIDLGKLNMVNIEVIAALEDRLKVLQSEIGRLYILTVLWLYYKNRGAHFLKEALQILVKYFGDFNIERESTEGLFTYKFLNNVFYYIPLFFKLEEIDSFEEFKEFLAVYEGSAEKFINETFIDRTIVEHANAPFWFLKPLFSYYCSRRLIGVDKSNFKRLLLLLFEKYIELNDVHWISNVVDEMENLCFSKEEFLPLKRKLAECYLNEGSKMIGLKSIHFLRCAAKIFSQMEEKDKVDDTLRIMKEKEETIEWQQSATKVIPELKEALDKRTINIRQHLDQLYDEKPCESFLQCLFNNYILPDKKSVEKQSRHLPLTYVIATVTPMTEGRSGIIEDEEKAIEHWKAEVLRESLFSYYLPQIISLLNWFLDKYGKDKFKECLIDTSRKSLIYEEDREFIIENIIDKYFNNDIIGFVYSSTPQIEHSIKEFLLRIGINIRERNIKKLEEINLNTLLVNYKEYIVNVLGENFYEVLWLCFLYEYGLNIRNSISHGEGITYLRWEYATLLFFILNFIFFRARQILERLSNRENGTTEE